MFFLESIFFTKKTMLYIFNSINLVFYNEDLEHNVTDLDIRVDPATLTEDLAALAGVDCTTVLEYILLPF